MANNICNCPNPPGGKVVCESNQIAICRVRFGSVESECINIPEKSGEFKSVNEYTKFLNNLVFRITGEARFVKSLDIIEASDILKQGNYKNPRTGELVTFKLPEGWDFSK